MSATHWWVERAATGIELLAVAIIVATIAVATVVYFVRVMRTVADVTTYQSYRQDVARALMLGLEILVAADIIRTVALAPTLQNVLILGLLVVIRTFLSWGLVVEIEERWPWQPRRVERAPRRRTRREGVNDRRAASRCRARPFPFPYCIAIATLAMATRSWNSTSLISTSTRLIVPVNGNGESYRSETGETVSHPTSNVSLTVKR